MVYEHKIRRIYLAGFTGLALIVGGCTLDKPTTFTQRDVTVVEQGESLQIPTATLNDHMINDIGEKYRRYAAGAMDVTVTYDPKSNTNTASRANDALAMLVRKLGGKDVDVGRHEILPVVGSDSMVLMTYRSYTAQAPDGCTEIMNNPDVDRDENWDYELGCMNKSYLAQQIYNPRDLLGREVSGTEDARPTSSNIEVYKRAITYTTSVQAASTAN